MGWTRSFGALTAVVVDILREQAKRQQENQLAETQQRFSITAGSHMASTAFDKHVAFCEEYVAAVSRVVAQLRDILGVEELTRLRAAIVRNALA